MTDSNSQLIASSRLALQLMDLTRLEDNDRAENIRQLCQQAVTPWGNTAAVCIYPQFLPQAVSALQHQHGNIRLATVVNFPQGTDDLHSVMQQTREAIAAGANEVDLVFPYRALLAGDTESGFTLVQRCKAICAPANVLLKVILETGELKQPALIRQASEIAIRAGADFLKTSSGKVPVNATPESARIMLQTIYDLQAGQQVGFKAAGGVRTVQDAAVYLALAESLFGKDWLTPRHFRFGASGLLNNLLEQLASQPA